MSRPGTPKDNAVMERYMRTFKNHKILRNTIQDEFDQALSIQPQFKSYRKIINKFIKSLNEKINKKSFPETPNNKDKRIERTSQLMLDPLYTKAFSNVHGNDSRLEHVEQYRKESDRTHQYLAEIAAMKAEVIDKTPFDDQENNLQLAAITHRLDELYELIAANPNIIKKYVQEALEPLQETILELVHIYVIHFHRTCRT